MPASINGCGTTYYGSRDFHSDGSYITTEWIIFIRIPILPLASFRVLPDGDGQNYLVFNSQKFRVQRVPLCLQQVWNVYLTILIVIIAIALLFVFISLNGALALIYFVFLLSVLFFREAYLRWCRKIVRMMRSRNQFDRNSVTQQPPDASKDLDLMLELPLSLEEMCIGAKKQVSIEGDTIDVEVPAGISPGKRLRIRGKGKFDRDPSERGDLYLVIVAKTDHVSGSERERQGAEPETPRDGMLKVGEGTSSVFGIMLGDDSLSAGIIQNGSISILPNRKDANKVADLFAFTENGDKFINEVSVALSFQRLIEDARSYFNVESRDIVVAVPCWFGIPQHNALKRVAANANLQLLRCYTSPVLAGIGCKFHSNFNQKIVVFEISSSSLSVAILEIGNSIFEVLSTYGERLNSDPVRVEHLCRISLIKLLDDSQLNKNQIDEVILLGDSSNAMTAQQVILDILNRQPVRNPRSGTEVIVGTSICAGVFSGVVKDILVLDVTPWSLGIETQENAVGTKIQGGMMTKIIPRNTTIPVKKTEVFSTAADGQTEVVIHVLQGEKLEADDNVSLGILRLDGILPASRGVSEIEVTFDINANGTLYITARVKGSDKELSVVLN